MSATHDVAPPEWARGSLAAIVLLASGILGLSVGCGRSCEDAQDALAHRLYDELADRHLPHGRGVRLGRIVRGSGL